MRVLVTGAAGFLGARLCGALVARGDAVVAVDDLSACPGARLLDGIEDCIDLHVLDVRSRHRLHGLPSGGFDRVYHLASSFANARSLEEPARDYAINVAGTANVLELARARGCGLFIYTGSSSSYGAVSVPFREEGPMKPETPYARTKLRGEELVAASGLDYAVLRLFNVYGPGDYPGRYRNVIPSFVAQATAPNPGLVVTGGDATRDFTYVDDVMACLLESDRAAGRIVNVGTGVETPTLDLADWVRRRFALPPDSVTVTRRRSWDTIVRRCADTTLLRTLFARPATTPLAKGLSTTVCWLADSGFLRGRAHEVA